MYLYAKEELTKELAEKEAIRKQKQQEINEVSDKLESIASYNKIDTEQLQTILQTILCIIVGVPTGAGSIGFIVGILKKGFDSGVAFFSSIFTGISVFFLAYVLFGIKLIRDNHLELKRLKEKGVKNYIKQKDELKDLELELKKENDNIQSDIDEINSYLAKIDSFNEMANDIFYQADSKEEYEARLNDKIEYEQLLDEFLNERIDYSRIHLNTSADNIDLQKNLGKKLMKTCDKN